MGESLLSPVFDSQCSVWNLIISYHRGYHFSI